MRRSGGTLAGIGIEKAVRVLHSGGVNVPKFLVLPLVACVTAAAGCKKADADSTPVAAAPKTIDDILPKQAQPKLATMKIYVGAEVLDSELALTELQEATGMMYRTNIQDSDSMLFVLPYTQQANFWMKNCPESISAAYISTDGTILEIHHLEKNDTNGVMSAAANIRFVLETSDGWFARHNVAVGTVMRTERGTLAETFLRQ